jgi:hypothetical protein
VVTPGVAAGELLHVLSPLERRSTLWDIDPDSARQSLSAAVSLVLRRGRTWRQRVSERTSCRASYWLERAFGVKVAAWKVQA